MYQLKISTKAEKELKKISKKYQQHAIYAALEDIKEEPTIGKPLVRELTGRYSYRIGVYRLIYKISKKDKIVYIISVGHRSTIYQ